jgi:hypothetical protein
MGEAHFTQVSLCTAPVHDILWSPVFGALPDPLPRLPLAHGEIGRGLITGCASAATRHSLGMEGGGKSPVSVER